MADRGNDIGTAPSNIFEEAVKAIAQVSHAYCMGLRAMGKDSSRVCAADTKLLTGSVDIDRATKKLYPEDARWDFAIGYGAGAYFVEVHPASTSNVAEVINKARWLKLWLRETGKPLCELWADGLLHWVASGKVAIAKTSPQYRRLSVAGVRLAGGVLRLP